MDSKSGNAPLIVVVGETASGKSALAVRIAELFDGEIIAADSWTVYREFSVGTAKPSAEEQARIPHHLLDVADPLVGFSAAEYKRLTDAVITDITSRGKLPILAGGTGLYIDSVIFDYSFLPPSNPKFREQLETMTVEQLLVKIEREKIDSSGIDVRNKRRLIRLIETNGARPSQATNLRPNTLVIGLKTSAEDLRAKVSERVDAMFAAGLEREVATLANKYGWGAEPMKGIGYREFQDYFAHTQTLEQTRERIICATMNLAKRQRTWFKRNNSIHWISEQAEVVDLITTFLNK